MQLVTKNLIETLIAQPSLIKRPVLQTPQGYVIGFDEATYQIYRLKISKNKKPSHLDSVFLYRIGLVARIQVWLRPNAATPI
jgi:hypothetical protein